MENNAPKYDTSKLIRLFKHSPEVLFNDDIPLRRGQDHFFRLLHEGEVEYRPRKTRRWPIKRKEIEALYALKLHYAPTEEHLLVFHEPYYSYLKHLLPSAIRDFKQGNRWAVFALVRTMPGLLKARRTMASDPDVIKVPEKYVKQIEIFQLLFIDILKAGELRVGRKRQPRQKMKKIYFATQRLLDSGLDRDMVYEYMKEREAEIKSDLSKKKRERAQCELDGFHDGIAIEKEGREYSSPGRTTLVFHFADWIFVQYKFRYNRKNLSGRRKYQDLTLFTTVDEIYKNALRLWPCLKNKKEVINVARDLLSLAEDIIHKTEGNMDRFVHIFSETCWIYNGYQNAGARRYLGALWLGPCVQECKATRPRTDIST